MAARAGRFYFMSEFDSRDGRRVPASAHSEVRLLVSRYLDPLREHFGPTVVTSGFRSLTHNQAVGGAPRSFHRYDLRPGRGVAADVRPARGTVAEWLAFLDELGAGGLGVYAHFVHVDTRKHRARWEG
jgi:uncharacterized protein YcbK (DUF882 family)